MGDKACEHLGICLPGEVSGGPVEIAPEGERQVALSLSASKMRSRTWWAFLDFGGSILESGTTTLHNLSVLDE